MADVKNQTLTLENMLDSGETIIWKGRPVMKPYLFQGFPVMIFGCVFFGFALIWTIVASVGGIFACFGLPFMAVGLGILLTPLWSYFSYKNTEYAITSKRVLISSGFLSKDFKSIDFDKIQNLTVDITIIDNLFKENTGNIRIYSGEVVSSDHGYRSVNDGFSSIKDPYEVFKTLKKVSTDIKTDIEYPNKLRPDTNPGYNTEYKPENDSTRQ